MAKDGLLVVETTCFSIAKGTHKLQLDPFFGEKGKRWQLLRLQHHLDEKAVAKHALNGVVRYAAEQGNLEMAERYLEKLDTTKGVPPSIQAFNSVLQGFTSRGDWRKADEWFDRTAAPALHPQMAGLLPDRESYDIMVQSSAGAGDLVRAERYMKLALDHDIRPSRSTFYKLTHALLAVGQAKRAHCWMELLVQRGCAKVDSYAACDVKQELRTLRSLRTWQPEEHVDIVLALASSLAAQGNPVTANEWLSYVVECGAKTVDHPEVWERVRSATPHEIRPSVLFAESADDAQPPPSPSARLPAVLSGEERGEDGEMRMAATKSMAARKSSALQQGLVASSDSPRPGSRQSPRPPCTSWAEKRPMSRSSAAPSPTATASTRVPSSLGRGSPRMGWSSPSGTRPRSSCSSATDAAGHSARVASATSPAMRRLLEAKRSLANADRAAVALRGLPQSARSSGTAKQVHPRGTLM